MTTDNIILVTADSVRADYCFTDFSGSPTTPTLEELASNSVVFQNATSPGARTSSSVPEILSGELMPYKVMKNRDHRFRLIKQTVSENETLPERLSELGYSTVAITASPYTTSETGFDEIFDVLYDVGDYEQSGIQDLIPNDTLSNVVRRVDEYVKNKHWFNQWPNFYNEIIDMIDNQKEPYFVWVFLLDTHNPYLPPRKDRVESSTFGMYHGLWKGNQTHSDVGTITNLNNELPERTSQRIKYSYRDTIRSVDRFLGKIQQETRDDDPVLVFHSDHGEAFGEHGTYGHHPVVYEENIHIPFVVYNADERGVVEQPISLRKLPNMIIEYAKDNTSFSDERWTSEHTYSRAKDGTIAVRGVRWKYISGDEGEELYDIVEDPNETVDVSDENPQILSKMRARKEEFWNQIDDEIETELGEDINDEIVDRLESLGYVNE